MTKPDQSATRIVDSARDLVTAQQEAIAASFAALDEWQDAQRSFVKALWGYTVEGTEESRKFLMTAVVKPVLDEEEGLPKQVNELAAASLRFLDRQFEISRIIWRQTGQLLDGCCDAMAASLDTVDRPVSDAKAAPRRASASKKARSTR